MTLTNREWALLAWLGALIGYALYNRSTRGVTLSLVRMLFRHPIGTVLLIAITYVCGCVWLLAKLKIWTSDNLKTTILWALTFAAAEIFGANKIDESPNHFRKAVRETLSATILIAFIADSYTFSLSVELALVPIIAFIAMLNAVASRNPEHRIVEQLGTVVLAIVGLAILGKGVIEVIRNVQEFAMLGTARDFVVPILLSVMFLPFLYALHVYMVYEQVFVGLNFGIEDNSLRRHAKWKAILTFRSDLDLLKRWRRLVLWERPTDKDGVRRTLEEIRAVKERECHPPTIKPDQGWSPYAVATWLAEDGLGTGDYHRSVEDRWTASSTYMKLSDDFLPHTIVLHVDGNETAATQLTLVLHIAQANHSDVIAAEARFRLLAEKLVRLSAGRELSAAEARALSAGARTNWPAGNTRLIMHKDEWGVGHRRGYERTFVIRHNAHPDEWNET